MSSVLTRKRREKTEYTPKLRTLAKASAQSAMIIDWWYSGLQFDCQMYDPALSDKRVRQASGEHDTTTTTYRFPRFPNPLTSPIAADRFAGGRGTAFATHTNVSVNPACAQTHQPRTGSDELEGHVPQ